MATTIGALRVELSANIAKFEADMGKAAKHLGRVQRSFATFGSQATAAGQSLSIGLTAPLVGIGAAALRSSVAFESAFAGVIKTVDDATDGMGRLTPVGEALQQGFRDLSLQIPIAATELAGIGEVAGQLGIESENILGFTEVMAKLGVTTNLSAEEAATSLAQLANITSLPQTEFERLGSTVVALGNNLATNEAQIVDFGKRIASAGTIAGLTEPQILAIGGAMASVGIESEAGGTAVQKVLNAMTKSVAQGGEKLEIFARTAGLSAAEFQRAFREDAAGAFASFVTGLGQQGDAAFTTLDGLTLGNERVVRSFLSLAAKSTTLTDALALGTTAWEENTALAREADIRFQTTASQLKLLANQVIEAGRALGDILKPILQTVVGIVRDQVVPWLKTVVDRFKALSPEVQTSRILWLGFAAALGPALIAIGGVARVLTPLVPLFGRIWAAACRMSNVLVKALGHPIATAQALRARIVTLRGSLTGLSLSARASAVGVKLASVALTGLRFAIRGVIAALGPMILVFAAFEFAAWAAGALDLGGKLKRLVGITDDTADAARDADAAYEGLNDTLQETADTVETAWVRRIQDLEQAMLTGTASIEQLDAEIRRAGQSVNTTDDVILALATAIRNTAVAAGDVLTPAMQEIIDRADEITRTATESAAGMDDLGGALGATGDAAGNTATEIRTLTGVLQGLDFGFVSVSDRIKTLVQTQGIAADGTHVFGQRIRLASKPLDVFGVTLVPRATTSLGLLNKKLQQAPSVLDRFTGSLRSLWEGVSGGQGMSGVFAGIGAGITQGLGNLISGGLASLANVAVQGIVALGKKIGGFFTRIFGGPSEAELAGRQAWRSYADGLAAEANAEQIQQALGAGWANVEDAKAWIVLRDSVQKAGGSAAEAEALWTRWVRAIKQGPEAVAAVTRELDGWRQKAGEVAQAEAEIAARNTALAGSLAGLVEAGHAAFNPAQLDPYLAQMEELGLVTAAEAAALRQLADDAHVDWRAMEESATQYGVAMKTVLDEHGNEVQVFDESLLGLGHAQAKLTDEAGQLAAAWSLLTGEGTNTQVAIEGMTDEAQGFITKALEMGIALPEAMRPMLDAMVSQGRLTDENGDKLTDLSGITFAAPIAEGFDLLADKIQLLIITLGGPSGLSKAVEDMAASANLDIKGLAGEWAGMTDEMKTEFGSFAAFVEDRALREIAESAGLNYDAIAERWKGMTDAQQTAFGSFRDFLKNEELKKLADDAGLTFDDLEQQWEDMTDAQRDAVGSFRQFVNQELDKIKNKHIVVDLEYRQRETGRRPEHAPQPSGGGTGFQRGSPFRDFGRGTLEMLHGLERVMTAPEGRGIAAALERIQQGLGAIADLSGVRALAKGGLVTRPTLTTFAEDGPEVGIPLERLEEFGGGRRVEAKLDQLHQDFALLIDEFRYGLDPRRRERALVAAAALSTT